MIGTIMSPQRKSKGFTIIELIVVMAVFLFVVGAAITIFISIVSNQRKVLSEQQILNQISYTQEYMSKALRMAKIALTESDLTCMGSGNSGYIYLFTRYDVATQTFKGVKFINQSNLDASGEPICQEFFIDHENPSDASTPLVVKEIKDGVGPTDITSPDLTINYMKLAVKGSDGTDNGCASTDQCGAYQLDDVQPRITMLLNVEMPNNGSPQTKVFQTTVSQRNLKVK